ncbi:hypothetical protein VNO78_21532 [Psophocarpus tetragonolobus]|uniref:Uncharacterized protein n=1 Tax=Psophocarpus tetragonolobus TaxID=3891 RepID=A0AAN9SDG9_PSOTE
MTFVADLKPRENEVSLLSGLLITPAKLRFRHLFSPMMVEDELEKSPPLSLHFAFGLVAFCFNSMETYPWPVFGLFSPLTRAVLAYPSPSATFGVVCCMSTFAVPATSNVCSSNIENWPPLAVMLSGPIFVQHLDS